MCYNTMDISCVHNLVQLSDVVLLEHLPGVRGVTDILEALRRVRTCLFQEHFFTSRMLRNKDGANRITEYPLCELG